MIRQSVPSYRFDFRGGLSKVGVVERTCITIGGEHSERIRYRLDDQPLAASVGQPLSSLAADILDVCAAIYIADRLAMREVAGDCRDPSDRWHRRVHVVIPVRYPDRWRQRNVVELLEKLLAFLTDDFWSFEFRDRSSSRRPSEAQSTYLAPNNRTAIVALQSGGLDSLCGLAELAAREQDETILPVTVITNPRVRRAADSVNNEFRESLAADGRELRPARFHIGVSGIGRHRDARESTQRARALVFLAAGISTAIVAGTDRLLVCENGVGAISLPMTADHWGSRATRAMHPKTLMLLSSVTAEFWGQPLTIENTGLFMSKGEHVQRLGKSSFIGAARHTISCDLATYEGLGRACGKCTSCILRRVALAAAGLDVLVDGQAVSYRTDWFDPGTAWGKENTIQLVAMRDQVERMCEVVCGERGFAALDAAFPDLFDVVTLAPTLGLTEEEVEHRLLRLYQAHVREFAAFTARIDRVGWGRNAKVSELVSPAEQAAAG